MHCRRGSKNALITKDEVYITLNKNNILLETDKCEFPDPRNIMAKETENSKKESTSKKLIQGSKIELSALSRKTFINKEQLGHHTLFLWRLKCRL